MRNNLLKSINIKKAVLTYNINNSIVKKTVKLGYIDNTECYFNADFLAGFENPNKKYQAELTIYAPEGVYKTKITVIHTNVTLKEISFQCKIPMDWEFIQMRRGGRKSINIPFKIEYGDGYTIEATTYDLAPGGFAFITNEVINSIYRKAPANLTLNLDEDLCADLPDKKFITGVVFVREIEPVSIEENSNEKRYAYRFVHLGPIHQIIINKLLETSLK